MASTEVILKQKVENLGSEADIVKVRNGFARNFLIPKGLAMEATASSRRHIERLKAIRAERETKELEEAEKIAGKLRRLKLKFNLSIGQGGKAFGSVTSMDIAKAVTAADSNIDLERHSILLEAPIKSTGKFDVEVKLHPQVTAVLKISVNAEGAAEGAEQA